LGVILAVLAWGAVAPPGGGAGRPQTLAELVERMESIASDRFADESAVERLRALVQEAFERFPSEPAALYWRGFLLDRDRQTDEAASLWEECLRLEGEADERLTRRFRARAAAMLGAVQLERGDAAEAKRLALRAVREDPESPLGHRLLIDASFAGGKFDDALDQLRGAFEREGGRRTELDDLYFSLLARTGNWDELGRDVGRRLQRDRTDPVANHYAGKLWERKGDASRASVHHILAALNGSTQLDSTFRSLEWLGRASAPGDGPAPPSLVVAFDLTSRCESRLAFGLENDAEEIAEARQALAASPGEPPPAVLVQRHLAATLDFVEGKLPAARMAWEEIIKRDPAFAPAACRLAQILEVEEDPASRARAEELLRSARALHPRHALVREHDRIAAKLRATEGGVTIDALAYDSPLAVVGLQAGQTIARLDRKRLADLPPIERLRRVRLFGGGTIGAVDAEGRERTIETPPWLGD
jgi:tetratricopeptide (TPR) repeat protein